MQLVHDWKGGDSETTRVLVGERKHTFAIVNLTERQGNRVEKFTRERMARREEGEPELGPCMHAYRKRRKRIIRQF